MSNRYIPYGYKFEIGQPIPHPDESEIVQEIFDRYCAGDSLKIIAESLTHRQVEYSPGKTSWDKARIKRILENERYLGSGDYPALVDNEQFVVANLKKEQTKTNKLTIDDDIKLFKEITVCGKCGSPYRRTTWAKKGKKKIVWRCGTRLDYGTQFCNESPTIEEGALHTAIVNGIMNQYIDVSADMELLKANLDRALAPQVPGGEADIRARISELTQQKQDLVARCMEENDITKYELLLTKIVDELEQLNQRLEGIESQRKDRAVTESRMAEIDELLAQFADSGLEYDDILTRRLVSAIRVKSKDEIEITFKDGKTRTEIIE